MAHVLYAFFDELLPVEFGFVVFAILEVWLGLWLARLEDRAAILEWADRDLVGIDPLGDIDDLDLVASGERPKDREIGDFVDDR